jgi:tetratricopeptide (TPR) repeat protein
MSETKSVIKQSKPKVFVSSEEAKKPRPSFRPILITALIVAVLCIVAINGQPAKKSPLDGLSPAELAYNGYYSPAQLSLDKQANTGNAQTKAGVYLQKANIALDSKRYPDALKFAQQSETLYPSTSSAALIAIVQETIGNKSQAIDYYKKAISRYSNPSQQDQDDINYYQSVIKSLGGTI